MEKMSDEKKKEKKEKSFFEEILYYIMQECTRAMMDYFFDEWLGWDYYDYDDEMIDLDEIEDWDY